MKACTILSKSLTALMFLGPMLIVSSLVAGEADVVDVEIIALGDNKYRINTTVRHDDAGWEHYANRWDVLAPDGTVLGSRELAHPHDNEQPFTRSLTLSIPADITSVTIQANDLTHGLGGKTMTVDIKP
ncbi:MAG: hypothetical protein V3U65_02340 [Granulosicoccaceae bacterium]